MFFSLLPGTIGKYITMVFYRLYLKNNGERLSIGIRVKIQVPSNVKIGDNVSINDSVWIAANKDIGGGIAICSNVLIGPFTIIHSGNHNNENPDIPIVKQGFRFGEITIENYTLDIMFKKYNVILKNALNKNK
jgi:acetyltransferase-like isoleucine patch superfamily enzyme